MHAQIHIGADPRRSRLDDQWLCRIEWLLHAVVFGLRSLVEEVEPQAVLVRAYAASSLERNMIHSGGLTRHSKTEYWTRTPWSSHMLAIARNRRSPSGVVVETS